jgi:hypothetical protein
MTQWDYNTAHAAALKCNSKRDFDLRFGGAYAWSRRNGVLEEVTSHMRKDTLWNKPLAFAEAKKHVTRRDFKKAASGCVKWLERNSLMNEACQHMHKGFVWTFELVEVEAAKFDSRNEFHKGNSSAAQWAVKNNMMDKLFCHKLTSWDFESVQLEALKYDHRDEFRQKSSGAAKWAIRNNVWDTVCSHMSLASRSDYDCVYIWKACGFSDLYKIGISSQRLGEKRIHQVAGKYGFDVEVVYLKNTSDALRLEAEMLKLGKPSDVLMKKDGFSEFRHLGVSDFLLCLDIMGNYVEATT